MQVSITTDVEHDCGSPPKTYRGIVAGTPLLLRLFRDRGIAATYFHAWEFVDMTQEPIPYDCRFRTGQPALDTLEDAIGFLGARGGTFHTMRELAC
ncbi:MAG TPA: hypothetical protein VIJ42_00085 [Stellaceae bacterium]